MTSLTITCYISGMNKVLEKTKIGHKIAGVLSIDTWRETEDALEDLEMYNSKNLRRDIKKARREVDRGEIFHLEEAEKELGIG